MTQDADMREKRVRSIAKWLSVFLMPGQVSELRALHVGGQSKKVISRIFSDTQAMAEEALRCEELNPVGVYFTPNPLNPELLTQNRSARAEDVIKRLWLLVDIDPVRPAGVASTLEERQAAWEVLRRVRGSLEAAGCVGVVIGDSGNGFHCCFPIDLPSDESTRSKIKAILAGLHKRCSDAQAEVDVSTCDAPRIWKIPGLMTRKGVPTEDRPHRWSSLIECTMPTAEKREKNNAALDRLLMLWDKEEKLYKRKADQTDTHAYAKAALAKEVYGVANAQSNRNVRLNEAAFNLGTLVACGALTEGEVEEQLYDAACRCGLDKDSNCGPAQIRATIKSGLRGGKEHPRNLDEKLKTEKKDQPKEPPKNADNSTDPGDQDATAADLISMNATIKWAWPLWIPIGLLSAIAAAPGTGKTRFALDLARRIYCGMPWPDGHPPTFPPGSITLWVPADNQHAELATVCQEFGLPPEAVYLNATKKNPFAGTMLDALADLTDFEARIKRIKPALVLIDTSLNATDKSAHKPEDAKAFFSPLGKIAQRTQTPIICVTHLNKDGTALGKRIEGQCRVVTHLDKPDPDQEFRRVLYVFKSNSLYPPKLGVTMGGAGNEYDEDPPTSPDADGPHRKGSQGGQKNEKLNSKIEEASIWLKAMLRHGDKRVSAIRIEADCQGINPNTLYAAKDRLGIHEYVDDKNKKWWKVPDAIVGDGEKLPPHDAETGEIY